MSSNRPTRSFESLRWRIRISSHRLFIFCEGGEFDPSFYGRLAESSDRIKAAGYVLMPASMIRGTGGKAELLGTFDWFKKRRFLVQPGGTGNKVMAFVLDRDSDHVTGGMRRSPHVLYTRNYDIEAEIFAYGRDESAIGSAASLAPDEARAFIKEVPQWRHDAATTWIEWLKLCCVAKSTRPAGCKVTFSRASAVNTDVYGRLDEERFLAMKDHLRSCAGLNPMPFS